MPITFRGLNDDLRRRATASAILAVREAVNEGSIPIISSAAWLTETELDGLVGLVMYGWIKGVAEDVVAQGWYLAETLRQTSLSQEPWDEGAIAHILPMLSALPIDWDKPLGTWSKKEMTRFLAEALSLVRTAIAARDIEMSS